MLPLCFFNFVSLCQVSLVFLFYLVVVGFYFLCLVFYIRFSSPPTFYLSPCYLTLCTQIRHNTVTTSLILCWSHYTRLLKMCCVSGTKMLAIDPLSPVSYAAGLDQTCLSSTSHRCMIGLSLGNFWGQVNTWNSLLCSSNHFWSTFPLWQGTSSCWKRP